MYPIYIQWCGAASLIPLPPGSSAFEPASKAARRFDADARVSMHATGEMSRPSNFSLLSDSSWKESLAVLLYFLGLLGDIVVVLLGDQEISLAVLVFRLSASCEFRLRS